MSSLACPACHFTPLPTDAATCPSCGAPVAGEALKKPATRIEVQQQIEAAAERSQITGVQIEQVSGSVQIGFSAGEVQALLSDLERRFQLRPYTGESPYVGLASFQEADAGRFFGRERLVRELLERLKGSQFALVGGPSGSGKSSLVRAGLIPALKQGALLPENGRQGSDHWRYATLAPGRSPLESLGQALAGLAGSLQPLHDFRQAAKTLPAGTLSDWVEVILGEGAGRRLVLFIDQFEEVFTLRPGGEDAQRSALIEQIVAAAVLPGSRLVLLLAMRSDFVSACAPFPGLNNLLNQGFFQVGPMAPDELVSAIVRPALQAGVRLDPRLVSQIVADMSGEPGALPLMQFALQDLFEAENASAGVAALTLDGYLQRGGLQRALERYADRAFNALADEDQALARRVFAALVVPGQGRQDTARTALLQELATAGASPERVNALVRRLADARLVTTADASDGGEEPSGQTVRLAHERLLEAWPWLRRLVDENRLAITLQNDIEEDARRWIENHRDESYLYAGARLATAEERLQQEQISLSQVAAEFVGSAKQHRLALEQERTRKQEEERQRELQAARELAEAESRRAEAERQRAQEQADSARRIRRFFAYLAALAAIAVVLAVLSLSLWGSANRNAIIARTNEAEAIRQAATATRALATSEALGTAAARERETAVAAQTQSASNEERAVQSAEEAAHQASLARAGELAAQAQLAYDVSLSRSALLAVEASRAYTPSIPAAEQALRQVVQETVRVLLPATAENYAYNLATDPSGNWLAAGMRDGRVLLWSLPDGIDRGPALVLPQHAVDAGVTTLEAGGEPVSLLRFSEDAFLGTAPALAYATENGKAALLKPDALEEGFAVADFSPARVLDMVFLPDGEALLLFTSAGELYRWATGSFSPQGEPALVYATGESASLAAISPGGRFLAAAQGTTLQLWSFEGGDAFRENIVLTNSDVSALRFSPDERWLAAGEGVDTLWLWDMLNSTTEARLSHVDDRYSISSFRLSEFNIVMDERSTILAVGYPNGATWLWSLNDPELARWDITGEELHRVFSISLSQDGHMLAAGSIDGRLRLWDTGGSLSAPPETIYPAYEDAYIERMLITQDMRWLAAASENGALVLRPLGSTRGDPLQSNSHNLAITQIAIDSNHHWLVSSDYIGYSFLERIEPDGLRDDYLSWQPEDGFVDSPAFSNSGRWLASDGNQAINLTDVSGDTPTVVKQFPHAEMINLLAFSPDEKWLAVADNQSQFWLYSMSQQDGAPRKLASRGGGASVLEWTEDSRWLAAGFYYGTLLLWSPEEQSDTLLELAGHKEQIIDLYFDAARNSLISLDSAGAVYRWNLDGSAAGDQLAPPEDPADADRMVAGALRPGGEWVAKSRGFDFGIYLESLNDPNQPPRVLRGHDSAAGQIAFSPDGRYLASGGQQIYLWDLYSPLSTPVKLFDSGINATFLTFSPDGSRLAAGLSDGNVYLWRVRLEDLVEIACQLAGRNLSRDEWDRYLPAVEYRETCP